MNPLPLLTIVFLGAPLFAEVPTLPLVQTIDLPGVQGRIDHLDIDLAGERLFVAALENQSLEVIDLRQGRVVQTVPHLGGPQGVAYVPETGEVAVAARDTGRLVFLHGTTLRPGATLEFGDEADNLHLVPGRHQLLLGYGSGGVAFVDVRSHQVVARVPMGGHPEGLQAQISTGRVLVNVPTAGRIGVVDLATDAPVTTWSPAGVLSNFPLAVSETRPWAAYYVHVPGQVVLFDTTTGRTLSQTPAPGDIDDLFFDDLHQRLFLISGSGQVQIWSVAGPQPQVVARAPTGPGARTGLWVGSRNQLFVAVPRRGDQGARITVFGGPAF